MQRVNWPTRQEVVRLTLILILLSAFVAALLGVFDFVFSRALFFVDTVVTQQRSQSQNIPVQVGDTDQGAVNIQTQEAGDGATQDATGTETTPNEENNQ